ncbi:ankyrin repeat and MYND domain-containing protein 2 isoform X2 [Oratosquilla oratoria]|uniref:ankyrin repeat and MYND domain-containing protein 2 isoform X2 n=1 Tax=Oratosquilla oratoria TaxID=337810 RepID=UPI003F76B257
MTENNSKKDGDKSAPPPEIIALTNIGDLNGVKALLLTGGAKVDDTDESGMTALHHASYKGNKEMCQLLIDHGADPNSDSHDHRYSALHFAALSGNIDTVQLLLTAGAKTYHTNTLGRVASQMAAFVGNHQVVALINNYVPKSSVDYYTKPAGLEKEPKLPKSVADPLYHLIMQVTLHPVHIALTLEKSQVLMDNIVKAYKVLDLLCEKEYKRQENVNEVISMKFHYLSQVLKTLEKEMKKIDEEEEGKKEKVCLFESIIKKWLRANADGIQEHQEFFIRECIKSFPCVEMPLFMQLVRNITSSRFGECDALNVLSGAINGQRAFQDEKSCFTCGLESKSAKKCSKCKVAQYCDQLCQRLHWSTHKKFCAKLAEEHQRRQKQLEEAEKEKAAKEAEKDGKENKENEPSSKSSNVQQEKKENP